MCVMRNFINDTSSYTLNSSLSSFLRWVLAAEVNNELQYSRWDLMIAAYESLSNCLGRYGVAGANVLKNPWHLVTTFSICGPKVKCWSKVTPSSLTVFCGVTVQLSKRKWNLSGILLPTGLKTISWVIDSQFASFTKVFDTIETGSKIIGYKWWMSSSKCGVISKL